MNPSSRAGLPTSRPGREPRSSHLGTPSGPDRAATRAGLAYGVAAYGWWGLVAIYFKAVAHVPALQVLAHRVIWSVVLLALLMRVFGRWGAAGQAMRSRRTVITLLGTAVLIAVNWFVFIWAVEHGQVLQGSLGYFINPLVNVLLGYVFLGERLRRRQAISVCLAAAGVTYLTLSQRGFPAIALLLAFTFGFYGLLRKTAAVDALVGLTLETAVLAPAALGYVVFLAARGDSAFGSGSWHTNVLLALGGVVTAVPLLWFANAVRRLRLATIGFLQYIAPTMQFLLAVAAFGEPFSARHAVAFGCIWLALAIYSLDSLAAVRQAAQQK